jgi:tryptophan-rich sensory protein
MKWIVLSGWLLLCYAVAALGGWWTSAELTDWYLSLKRPRIAPPNWVFGPVWSLLYALMAIAAWEIWLAPPSPLRSKALLLFFVQLILNLLWTWLFFHEHDIANALANLCLLWIAIGAETVIFWRMQPSAAWLMVPYWAWVSFAVVLNFEYWRLNPDSTERKNP